jgi:hypothetical protein
MKVDKHFAVGFITLVLVFGLSGWIISAREPAPTKSKAGQVKTVVEHDYSALEKLQAENDLLRAENLTLKDQKPIIETKTVTVESDKCKRFVRMAWEALARRNEFLISGLAGQDVYSQLGDDNLMLQGEFEASRECDPTLDFNSVFSVGNQVEP